MKLLKEAFADMFRRIRWGSGAALAVTIMLTGFFSAIYLITKIHIAIAIFLVWIVLAYNMGDKVKSSFQITRGDDDDDKPRKSTYSR